MPRGSGIVGLDFDATVAWPIYDWMGVAKAALESVSRYLARDLGPPGHPGQPGLRRAAGHGGRARDPRLRAAGRAVARARRRSAGTSRTRCRWRGRSAGCCRTTRRAISGEIVHVDGGFHAVGAPPCGTARGSDRARAARPVSGTGPRRRRAAGRQRPGPSSAVTWRPAPLTSTAGCIASLARARSAAAASSSATAIQVALQLAARGCRRARASPRAAPGRRSRWRRRPGRGARPVRTSR